MCYIFYVKKKKPLSPAYLDGVNVVLKQVYIYTCTWNSGACNLTTPSFFLIPYLIREFIGCKYYT